VWNVAENNALSEELRDEVLPALSPEYFHERQTLFRCIGAISASPEQISVLAPEFTVVCVHSGEFLCTLRYSAWLLVNVIVFFAARLVRNRYDYAIMYMTKHFLCDGTSYCITYLERNAMMAKDKKEVRFKVLWHDTAKTRPEERKNATF